MNPAAILGLVLVSVLGLAWLGRRLVVIGEPDEWVLHIRNGELKHAGVGIFLWRWPQDRVVRFPAAIQRVTFAATALSAEHLPVALQGFILWSVCPQGDAPFRAYSRLGIQNRVSHSSLADAKHLLTKSQHHAFQHLVAAVVERHLARFRLHDLLASQDELVRELMQELRATTAGLGISIDDLQVLQVRPSDPTLLGHLSAPLEAEMREAASRVRLETEERIERRALASKSELAQARVLARRDEETAEARATVEVQQHRAELLAAEHDARRRHLEHEHRLTALEQQLAGERALAAERGKNALARVQTGREEEAFTARLERRRRLALVRRDAMRIEVEAEESKSPAVRAHELARLSTLRMAEAFARLPLRDARWVSVGDQSPAQALASLLATGRELCAPSEGATPGTPDAQRRG